MKAWWVFGIPLIAVAAAAQVLRPVDLNRRADVNGKVIQPELAPLADQDLTTRTSVLAPGVNGQRAATKLVSPTIVRMPTKELPTKELSTRPVDLAETPQVTEPQATVQEERVETSLVPRTAAPVTNRTIDTASPRGQQELRDQLRRRP